MTYFQKRMDELGITPDINTINIQTSTQEYEDFIDSDGVIRKRHKIIYKDEPIFKEVPEGIEIMVYTIDRNRIYHRNENSRWGKFYSIIRYENPVAKNGQLIKYRLPKGNGTFPFFSPPLIKKYVDGTDIHTLILTEGYFKAFKGCMHNLNVVGLSSITHMKDAEKNAIHQDIMNLIRKCNVQRIIWLTDGDCIDITNKELVDGIDLYKKPNGFFNTISTFKNLLDDLDIEKWFFHIDIDNIIDRGFISNTERDKVKGLDDLLVNLDNMQSEIISDLSSVAKNDGFFKKFNVSYGLSKIRSHFHLIDVKDFYLYHVDKRPELKDKEFIFNGTRYRYNEETDECDVKIPGDANLYFRVADNYFKFIQVPNQYQQLERVFHERKKTTIIDDHGKNFTKYIPKFEAFCNVPDHVNFQQITNNCFNVYSPLDFEPEDEDCTVNDCPTIISFLNHIFGDRKCSYKEPGKERVEHSNIDIILDYLQLIYQQPWRKLPIICLVSKENNTGKSTFANFLRLMLGANVAIVGNADLANDFNAHWATKNVVICDETKIDKQHVIEKIKSLSTAKKIFMNAKGRGQVELDCFLKFVLITNNEDNFITLSSEDIRYWIIKVPQLKNDNPNILEKFVDEMPAFLSFLSKRSIATEQKGRMWFHPELLKTEAFKKIVNYSMPVVEKEIRHFFKEMFLDTGLTEIRMTLKDVHKQVFNNKYEKIYVKRIIDDNLKVEPVCVYKVNDIEVEYNTMEEAIAVAAVKFNVENIFATKYIKKISKVLRYSYPKWEEVYKDNKKQMERFEVTDIGRPYLFKRSVFIGANDIVSMSDEAKFTNEMLGAPKIEEKKENPLPF